MLQASRHRTVARCCLRTTPAGCVCGKFANIGSSISVRRVVVVVVYVCVVYPVQRSVSNSAKAIRTKFRIEIAT